MTRELESRKDLVDEKVTRRDGSQENSLPPLRGRVGVGGNFQQHKPRPCGCNTRKLVNNRFPARKGWGLRGDTPQSLINDKNLFAYSPIHLFTSKRVAFTLAEVLITLGVIGIVAAMTIPTLVTNYQKKVTETKLRRFYATMTNAIKLEEAEIGSLSTWLPDTSHGETFEQWYNNHLDKHIKSLSKSDLGSVIDDGLTSSSPNFLVGLADGSGFVGLVREKVTDLNYVIFFYCTEIKECGVNKMDGKKSFLFSIITPGKFVPSIHGGQSKTREELLESCKYGNYDNHEVSTPDKRHDCALLIMRDGWEIKDDYPWDQVILPKK